MKCIIENASLLAIVASIEKDAEDTLKDGGLNGAPAIYISDQQKDFRSMVQGTLEDWLSDEGIEITK